MSLYEGVNAMLVHCVQRVDRLIQEHLEARKDANRQTTATWGDDSAMSATIGHIKNVCKVTANSGLKFVLVSRARPSDAAMKSLLDELSKHVDILLAHYMNFVTQPCSECLFDAVSRAVRTFLSHIEDLVKAVQAKQEKSLNYMVGMIEKISEDIGKLPESNKLAYRLLFLEQCLVMKETVQEFKAYLEEAAEKAQAALDGGMEGLSLVKNGTEEAEGEKGEDQGEGEDEDEDEDGDKFDDEMGGEEDELDYTPKEVQVVDCSVKLLGRALACVKQSLQIVTGVCDRAATTVPNTVFSATSSEAEATEDVRRYSHQWVAQLARQAEALKKDALDLGAELYPPFEGDCAALETRFQQLRTHCAAYLQLLDAPALHALQAAEDVEKIALLGREVAECALSCAAV